MSIRVYGDAAGRYNFFQYPFTVSQDISTFNASLCAVQAASVSKASIRTYAPGNPINSFTQFAPTSGYLILARQNFVIPENPSVRIRHPCKLRNVIRQVPESFLAFAERLLVSGPFHGNRDLICHGFHKRQVSATECLPAARLE